MSDFFFLHNPEPDRISKTTPRKALFADIEHKSKNLYMLQVPASACRSPPVQHLGAPINPLNDRGAGPPRKMKAYRVLSR